jgi:hypothetical protein
MINGMHSSVGSGSNSSSMGAQNGTRSLLLFQSNPQTSRALSVSHRFISECPYSSQTCLRVLHVFSIPFIAGVKKEEPSSPTLSSPAGGGVGSSRTNLIINYLPQAMNNDEVQQMFSAVGELASCKLVKDKITSMCAVLFIVQHHFVQTRVSATLLSTMRTSMTPPKRWRT